MATCSSYSAGGEGGNVEIYLKQEHAKSGSRESCAVPSSPQQNHRGAAAAASRGSQALRMEKKPAVCLYILGLFGSVQMESSWLLAHRQHVSDFGPEEMRPSGFGHLLVTKRCPC